MGSVYPDPIGERLNSDVCISAVNAFNVACRALPVGAFHQKYFVVHSEGHYPARGADVLAAAVAAVAAVRNLYAFHSHDGKPRKLHKEQLETFAENIWKFTTWTNGLYREVYQRNGRVPACGIPYWQFLVNLEELTKVLPDSESKQKLMTSALM